MWAPTESENTVKTIILSAGQGRRLLPLTEETPKSVLPIGGKSALGWQLAALEEAGASEVVVATGFHAPVADASGIAGDASPQSPPFWPCASQPAAAAATAVQQQRRSAAAATAAVAAAV